MKGLERTNATEEKERVNQEPSSQPPISLFLIVNKHVSAIIMIVDSS